MTPLALALILAAPPGEPEYLAFVHAQAAAMRAADPPPATTAAWNDHLPRVRAGLRAAWGDFPGEPAPLAPVVHGSFERDGYRVEKITFATFPGVRMTANAYVPKLPGRHPAILQVHGHWKGAKQDPVVQARCIGAAKLGFFVLCVDAFGAGERGVGTALGEYHGGMTGATLLPAGRPLSGVQVYENLRAVDYLRTRPEVNPDKIGVTGASGGGNQSMYAGAWDTRLSAVVPVCSVGNYQAYLGAACCMCEVVPGALSFSEESGVLGLSARRGLMVISATKDARQFSVDEAKKSIAIANTAGPVHHAVFDSPHDYNKTMREAMYGWMTKHLKGEGDGGPIPEPAFTTEAPEALRIYPGDTRPADWPTLPQFAAAEGRKLLAAKPTATLDVFRDRVLGGFPAAGTLPPLLRPQPSSGRRRLTFAPEAGLTLTAFFDYPAGKPAKIAIVLNLDGEAAAEKSALAAEAKKAGFGVVTLDLRATGAKAVPGDAVGAAPDHNSAEWGLWLGRPLLGQWAFDVKRLLDAVELSDGKLPPVVVMGDGPAGLVALAAAACDPRITKVLVKNTLATYVTAVPYSGQRLGVIPPGILKHFGDVSAIAGLIAPRPVVIAGGVDGAGKVVGSRDMWELFPTATVTADDAAAGMAAVK